MKKEYKFVLVLAVVYVLVMAVLFFFNLGKKENGYATLFFDNYSKWIYSDGKWSRISDDKIGDYNWKKYDLYYENEYLGNYYLMNNDGSDDWHIFDDDTQPIEWKFGTMAFGGSIKSEVKDIKVSNMSSSEYSYAKKVIDSLKIGVVDVSRIKLKEKYVVDIDDDGNDDTIYSISNAQMEGEYLFAKAFTVLFVRKNNKNIILYKKIVDDYNSYSGCIPSVSVFKLENSKSNIMVNCATYSAIDVYSYLYQYNKNKNNFSLVFNEDSIIGG